MKKLVLPVMILAFMLTGLIGTASAGGSYRFTGNFKEYLNTKQSVYKGKSEYYMVHTNHAIGTSSSTATSPTGRYRCHFYFGSSATNFSSASDKGYAQITRANPEKMKWWDGTGYYWGYMVNDASPGYTVGVTATIWI